MKLRIRHVQTRNEVAIFHDTTTSHVYICTNALFPIFTKKTSHFSRLQLCKQATTLDELLVAAEKKVEGPLVKVLSRYAGGSDAINDCVPCASRNPGNLSSNTNSLLNPTTNSLTPSHPTRSCPRTANPFLGSKGSGNRLSQWVHLMYLFLPTMQLLGCVEYPLSRSTCSRR